MDASFNRTIFSSAIVANILTILDDDDDYWEEVFAMLYVQGYLPSVNPITRQPCRTRPFTGHQFIGDILNDHPDRGYQQFRMTTTTFIALRDELVGKGLLRPSRHITVDEQLGIFLFGIGHGIANRVLAETFQHSGETISKYFNRVLRAIVMLKDEYIILPTSNTEVHPRISDNINFHPFKNAIGAVDGIHIPAIVKLTEQARFRCRKGFTSQNVMAAVNFDQQFVFVCTGWEGSATDMQVLRWACETGGFTVPEGKFYLVDSGYANTDKFLAPYQGERYHISQFDSNAHSRVQRSPRDLYNHHHSQLRNVVEKTFRILKRRFKILNIATPFPFRVQCLIVMACCVIHNFIRRNQGSDRYFNDSDDQPATDVEEDDGGVPFPGASLSGASDSRRGDDIRNDITEQLWNNRS